MKTQYEAYKIGSEVWAIAEHYADGCRHEWGGTEI